MTRLRSMLESYQWRGENLDGTRRYDGTLPATCLTGGPNPWRRAKIEPDKCSATWIVWGGSRKTIGIGRETVVCIEVCWADQASPSRKKRFGGRPTSSLDLIQPEAQRQLAEAPDSIPDLVAAWGRDLSEWLASKHPNAPQALPETVAGWKCVRDLHRRAKARKALNPKNR
jgi:hypothetical protein